MIIAVDFDGTLSLGKWPACGPANEKLISQLIERQKKGDKIILWTCREFDDLKEAVKWSSEQGLIFDAVNENLPEIIERWGASSRKIECDIFIDDKAVGPDYIFEE